MWRELGRDVVRLVVGWWRGDRVRVSPEEGRLLRLEPPCFVVVAGRPAEVLSRTLGHDPGGAFVAYECRSAGGSCRLRIGLGADGAASDVAWTFDEMQRSLRPEEVETYVPFKPRRPASNDSMSAGGST